MARCCVSDRWYLFFDPFSSTIDFFESYAMREIEGLSLFSYGFVLHDPLHRLALLRFVLGELAIF